MLCEQNLLTFYIHLKKNLLVRSVGTLLELVSLNRYQMWHRNVFTVTRTFQPCQNLIDVLNHIGHFWNPYTRTESFITVILYSGVSHLSTGFTEAASSSSFWVAQLENHKQRHPSHSNPGNILTLSSDKLSSNLLTDIAVHKIRVDVYRCFFNMYSIWQL